MLRTNQSKITGPNHAARVNVSRNAFFSSRSERKHFLWRWYCHKNVKIEIWFVLVCTLIDNEYTSLLFCQTLFSYCFCLLSDFAKVFEWKVWRVQVAHLHNAARAIASPSRCFQLSTNFGKNFFRYLWYCDKNQIECGLARYWWNSTDLGLIDMLVLINLNTEIVACILSFRKSRHKPNLENTTKYGFSPDLGEKMAAFWACACKLS